MPRSEFSLIQSILGQIPRSLKSQGLGDDTAILPQIGSQALLTTDAIVDGVDFVYGRTKPEAIGYKALAINLSDMAAMGGKPLAFVVTLALPKKISDSWVRRFYQGMLPLAKKYKVSFAGGDLSSSRQLFISIALWGKVIRKPILRSGAKAGDLIAVTGSLGGSILGHHLSFKPRLSEAEFLAKNFSIRSMIDLSDGLIQDLGHVLRASKVGAKVSLEDIPVSRDALKLAKNHRQRALQSALSDGEDFELLFTVSKGQRASLERRWRRKFPRTRLSWIGAVTNQSRKIQYLQNGKPVSIKLKNKGFTHF